MTFSLEISAPRRTLGLSGSTSSSTIGFRAPSQCVHQVDDLRLRMLPGFFNLLTAPLLPYQLFECALIVIFEFLRLEMPGL